MTIAIISIAYIGAVLLLIRFARFLHEADVEVSRMHENRRAVVSHAHPKDVSKRVTRRASDTRSGHLRKAARSIAV